MYLPITNAKFTPANSCGLSNLSFGSVRISEINFQTPDHLHTSGTNIRCEFIEIYKICKYNDICKIHSMKYMRYS